MNFNNFWIKNKKKIIYIVIILLVGLFLFRIIEAKFNFDENDKPVKPVVGLIDLGNIENSNSYIYTTGKVESLNQLDIKSELSAKVKKINFNIGDNVQKGQIILELDNSTLAAQLSQAQASLDKVMVGASNEDIKIYETAVELAKADLEKSQSDTLQAIKTYEIALKMAENNLNVGSDTLVDILNTIQPLLNSSLSATDDILGIDQPIVNDSFEDYLSSLDPSKLNDSKLSYDKTKFSNKEYNDLITILNKDESEINVNNTADKAKEALSNMETHLSNVQKMLDVTVPVPVLTQTSLNTMKSTITTLNGSINEIDIKLTSAMQGKTTAGGSLNSYNLAYEKAKQDLDNAKVTADNVLKIKQAAYDQAVATLNKIKADPREVDLAALRAVVSQSAALYDKSIIRAPFSGIISSMPYRVGDMVGAGQIITGVVNKEGLQVRAYISQKERSFLKEGDSVVVEDKYNGIVSNIAPSIDSTNKKIEVIIAITDENVDIAIGQYANVKIAVKNGDEFGKFIVPLTAIKNYTDRKTVFYLNNNSIEEKEVTLGNILGDNVEIINGLSIDDKILSSVANLKVGEEVEIKTN